MNQNVIPGTTNNSFRENWENRSHSTQSSYPTTEQVGRFPFSKKCLSYESFSKNTIKIIFFISKYLQISDNAKEKWCPMGIKYVININCGLSHHEIYTWCKEDLKCPLIPKILQFSEIHKFITFQIFISFKEAQKSTTSFYLKAISKRFKNTQECLSNKLCHLFKCGHLT